MKKIFLLAGCICMTAAIQAQSWLEATQKANPDLNEIKSEFQQYWRDKDEEKGRGIKPFKRWEWFWETRLQPGQPLPKRSIAFEEWTRYQQRQSTNHLTRAQNANWIFSGPATSQSGYYGIGRLNAIAFHPTDPNTYYVGAPAGGLWKTTNDGASWTVLTDNLPVIGVSDIAIDPSNPSTIYIVTGDGDGGDTYSIGVLKSTNGGVTWNTTGLSFTVTNFKLIKRIQIHPQNPQILWVAASDGIWRTLNGGTTWTNVQSGSFVDLELNPTNPNVIYAASYTTNSSIFRSSDGGATFNLVQTITGGRRVNLAVAANNSNIIHALACNSSGGLHSLWKSSDGGLSFNQYLLATTSNNMLHSSASGNGSGGQGTYDLAFAINPVDSNNIWLGGINTWSSDDGGSTWNIKTIWSGSVTGGGGIPVVHADKHAITFHPITKVLYECNDGGIYRTANRGSTWTDLSNGLGISQIYRIGVSSSTTNQVLLGLQDNSTKEFKNNTWFERMSTGDGFESIYEPQDANVMYVSSYYGNIRRSLNGGSTWSIIAQSSGTGINSQGPWLTPYIMNPINSNTLLVAKKEVYRTDNRGTTWTQLTSFGGTTNATAIAFAPSDTLVIYAAFGNRLEKTTDGGATWTNVATTATGISYIAVHPSNPQRLWITHASYSGNKVQASVDGGLTWTALNGTLPNLPVNCIVYQNGSNDGLYIGTDVGVYYRDNTLTDWIPYQAGLPNVIVNELEITYNNNRIWAATYGRGLWSSTLYSTPSCVPPPAPASGGNQSICPVGSSVTITATPGTGQVVDWYNAPTGGSVLLAGNNTYTTSTPGIYYASARNTANGCESGTRTAITVSLGNPPATPTISFTGNTTFCAGGTLTLQSSATTGNQWYINGITIGSATQQSFVVNQSGSYTVNANTGGCASGMASAVSITVHPMPQQPTISVSGSQLTSSSSSGNQWFLNGVAINGATAQTHNATATGSYTVVATVNGCQSLASNAYNHVTTALPTTSQDQQLQIAPNPVRDQLEISYNGSSSTFEMELLDMKGSILHRSGRFTNRYSLSMRMLSSGSYIVRISNVRTGERIQKMVVKQ